LENYTITKKFKSEEEKDLYIKSLEDEKTRLIEKLGFKESFNHIYNPLFVEDKENLDVYISPDRLNE